MLFSTLCSGEPAIASVSHPLPVQKPVVTSAKKRAAVKQKDTVTQNDASTVKQQKKDAVSSTKAAKRKADAIAETSAAAIEAQGSQVFAITGRFHSSIC